MAQVDRAVAAAPPAMEGVAAHPQTTITGDAVARLDRAAFERCQGDGRLERRSRRVLAGYRLVGQRRMRILDQRPPFLGCEAAAERTGVVAGRRDQGQDLATLDIHQHDRANLVPKTFGGVVLQIKIECQRQVRARLPLLAVEFTYHPADGIDLDLGAAAGATQNLVVRPLDPRLADAKPGQVKQRIILDVTLRHGRNVADDMNQRFPLRILPAHALLNGNTGKVDGIDLDVGNILPAQVLGHRDRNELPLLPCFLEHPTQVGLADRHDLVQRSEREFDIARLLGHQQHPIILQVRREQATAPIKDAAARRRDHPQIDPVVLGKRDVPLRLNGLQVIEAPAQCREEKRLATGEHRRPA